jgi:adenylate kinase family enzyme
VFSFYDVSPAVIYVNTSIEWSSDKLYKRGRHDDTKEGVASRMNLFEVEIMPIIEMYKKENKIPIIEVNGEQAIEKVHEDIKNALGL